MPEYPGKILCRANDGEQEVKSTQYRSITGKLMYNMTKVAPKTANAIQELGGQMVKPMAEHWKALDRAIGYVLKKWHKGLVLKKSSSYCKPYIYADSNYANDEDDWKSISGCISTLGGMIVSWGSKKQHTVS